MKEADPKHPVWLAAWLSVLVMAVSGCVVTDSYLARGKAYTDAKDWDKGVRFYQEALEKYPNNTEVRLMLERARWQASQTHKSRGEVLLKEGNYNQAIVEFQLSLAMIPSDLKVAALIRKAKNMREAELYLRQGENFLKARQFVKAKEVFQKVLNADSENPVALKYLSYFEKKESHPPRFRLRVKNRAPISLKFKQTPILNVFEILSQLTGVNFIFDKDVKETKVTLFMTDVSFDRFIEVLLETHELEAKLMDEKTMIIYPDTPAKVKEYKDLQIRTFYLANLNTKTAVALLSKVLKSKNIIANEALNAVVIRAPGDTVEIASRIIEANDRALAEVMLNVEILEVSRSKERQLGLNLSPTSMTLGLGESALRVDEEAVFVSNASIAALDTLSKREMMLSVPTVTLNFLKQDGDTRTLANPQIRVRSGNQSKVLIGERIPLRTNRRVDTSGVVTYDFQYFDIGVKLNAKPTINIHGEVTLEVNLEVSALGSNLGTSDDPQYSIRTRTAQSILTVSDGESVIIGGLISDEERETIWKVPFLGDIPVVGRLFANQDTSTSQTDVLMAITPVLTRHQEVPDIDVAKIWSGSEDRLSRTEPYESIAERAARYADRPGKPVPIQERPRPRNGSRVILPELKVQ